ncbi:Rho family DH domain-containing guanine nucleotide exchange factor [Suillus paluster]|uniref:Rho family DH domain-containing guanine nucleotide exchange factor n=1 Tax=Suillus paluster TaxID=48578 RepID=UPI001B873184|nr:Rho family DH domain-containing guanine nucleotide exchange factor [Suillus paluster]KAG1726883.1 Dbl homology domain-containing protein [Suillus paluster]
MASFSLPTPTPALTKRRHALLELLTSERAYASDLALIRDVYINLASDLPHESSNAKGPIQPPRLTCDPPLSTIDIRIIFRNISTLATLSDMLVSKLEKVTEGGKGLGEVFLKVIPLLTPPYMTYITTHPRALAHLDALSAPPQLKPQFSRWLKESKELVEAHTHALDLPSLLMKPVQRFMKYRLLLSAVINATPEPLVVVTAESGGTREVFGQLEERAEGLEKLREAKQKAEEAARFVNKGRRRVEIIREVLGSGHAKDGAGGGRSISIPKMGVVNASISRLRFLRTPKKGSIYLPEIEPDPEHAEAALVAALESKLKLHITTLSHLARDAVAYARTLHALFGALVKWGWAFAGVIGVTVSPELNSSSSNPTSTSHASTPDLTGTDQSEAFDAFLALCTGLIKLTQELEHELHTHILPSLQSLKSTSVAPLKLLSAQHTLQPLHLHLLHLPITRKHRPPEVLLQASQSYVALRGQLALELPVYVRLLERGINGVVLDLARVMEAFWEVVGERWGELWDALVDGEDLGGAEDAGVSRDVMGHVDRPGSRGETVRVWRERWGDVLGVLGTLAVINFPRKIQQPRAVNSQHYVVQHGQQHYRTSPQHTPGPGRGAEGVPPVSSALHSPRLHSPQTPTVRITDLQGLCALYQCAVIHTCIPPSGMSYRGIPFFEVRSGDTFDVLREYGHPSTHPDLPLYVDDGEDCLLLVRELADGGRGEVGWALASFLEPLN